MTLRGPAAQLGAPGDQGWSGSAGRSYWDSLMSEVEVVPRLGAFKGRIAPRPRSATEGRGPGQSLDAWLEDLEKMQGRSTYRRGSRICSPGSRPNDQVAQPWPAPTQAHVRPQSATEGSRQMNDWLHELERMQSGGSSGESPPVNPEVGRRWTGRTPRTHGATAGGSQQLEGCLQELERMEDGSSKWVQTEAIQAPFRNRTSSMPTLHREPVGPRLPHYHPGLSPSSSHYGGDESLCSSDLPSLCDSSPGSLESLGARLSPALDHRGSWERASIKPSPGKEQAKLSSLTPVRVGWLPIQKRALMLHTGLPESSASQVKLKPPITPTFGTVPVKGNGLRLSDAEAETVEGSQRSTHAGDPGTRWHPDQRPDRESPVTQQVAGKQSSASVPSGTRPLGWQALRRTWAKRTWLSPLRGCGTSQSKDTLPGPGADKEAIGTSGDIRRPSTAKVTACGTNRTLQYPDDSEPCWRSSLRRTNSFETAPTGTVKPPVQQTPSHAEVTSLGSCPTQPPHPGLGTGPAGGTPKGTTITAKTARQAFSSITIASKKVSRTASLPGSRSTSPQIHYSCSVTHQDQVHHPTSTGPDSDPATLSRKSVSTGMDSETVNQPKGWQSPVSPGHNDTVVSRRKVTIIKVTENRHSYSPGQQGGGGSGGNSSSYSEGVMTENGLWQQGTVNSPEPLYSTGAMSSSGHLEPPVGSKDRPSRGPTLGPDASTSTNTVTSSELQGSGGGVGRPVHKSTLFIHLPSPSSEDMFAGTRRGGEGGEGGEEGPRPRRPTSCYAVMFEHTETAKWSPGPGAVASEHGLSAPRHRSLGHPRHAQDAHADPVAMSRETAVGNGSTTGSPVSGSSVGTGAAGGDCGTGQTEEESSEADGGGAKRKQDPPRCPDQAGFRSRPPPSPALTLIKPQDPVSKQHSPETILALNAAAVIANIKLQRQLGLTKTSSQNGLSRSTESPQGNTLAIDSHTVNATGGPLRAEADDRMPKPDGGHQKRSRISHPNQNHVVFVPLDPNSDPDISTDSILSPREALERSRPDFIRRSQDRVRDMERRAEERRERPVSNPLSDNLFRPRDRAITGKKIYHGSRQKQRKQAEEARRREMQQINRMRADLFKKKLLDQILQRGSD